MTTQAVELTEFLHRPGCIFDVRSPAEFSQGQLPGSYSLPLFSNEERVIIGTTYKQVGRKEAVIRGMDYLSSKFSSLVEHVESTLTTIAPNGVAKIHCWRGGMRSQSIAVLIGMTGIPCITLEGGYKAYRQWVFKILKTPFHFRVIGGMTGSGKTDILHCLKSIGAQILDLEALANHRGSSFGHLGLPQQPSYEQFENTLADHLSKLDPTKPVWVEDESRLIGTCKIPDSLYHLMQTSPLFWIQRPIEERLEKIKKTYWTQDPQELIKSTLRLTKKLGLVKTNEVITAIENQDFRNFTLPILEHYDRSYRYQLQRFPRPHLLISENHKTDMAWASQLLNL